MKKNHLSERLLALLVCVFAWVGVNAAVTVTTDNNGYTVVTVTGNAGQLSDNVLAEGTNSKVKDLVSGKTKLKLVGSFNNDPDFNKLKSWCSPTHLDLTGATIDQGTVSYTYYYLDTTGNQKNVRYELSHDANGWYYTKDDVRYNVAEADVRIFTASVSGGQTIPGEWKNSLTYISLPTSENYNVVANQFCADFDKLTEIVIPNNITVIGGQAFKSNNSQLQSISLPSNLKAICYEAFYGTALTSITIPGSVEIIMKDAFTNCKKAKTLTFAQSDSQHHMIVKYYSFFNLEGLTDVYIQTNALVDCENEAFDYRITWGQGDTTRNLCTLHFSSEVAEHYANLTDPLTPQIAMNAKLFHEWLGAHYNKAQTPYANGWWEYINNGTIDEEDKGVKGKKFLCTFSDYDYDRIVPEGVKAYIVTGLKSQEGIYALDLHQIFVIPKRTGVILYGVSNSKDANNNDILSMSLCEIANGLPLRRDYWYALQGTDAQTMKNYLWPSCVTLDPNGFVNESYVYYEMNDNGTIKTDAQGDYLVHTGARKVLGKAESLQLKPWDGAVGNSIYKNPSLESVVVGDITYTSSVPENYDASVLNGFYRNFYMQRYCNTKSGAQFLAANNNSNDAKEASQYVGFFRCKNSSFGAGKAFLRLLSTEFNLPEGGEVIINGDTQYFVDSNGNQQNYKHYQVEYAKTTGNPMSPDQSGLWKTDGDPNMTWELNTNWGQRSLAASSAKFVSVTFSDEPEIFENGDGTATLIVPSSAIQVEGTVDEYYTLQGVRVTNPAKGVYIKNGKKVIIK